MNRLANFLLFVLSSAISTSSLACLSSADAARLNAGLYMPSVEAYLVQSATASLGSEVVGSKLLRFADLNPIEIFRDGRWEGLKESKLELSKLIGSKVRLFGNYVGATRQPYQSFIVGAPPDSCGGSPAVLLGVNLHVSRNPVIIEGEVVRAKHGKIGHGHPLIGVALNRAVLIAQGDAAVAFALAQ